MNFLCEDSSGVIKAVNSRGREEQERHTIRKFNSSLSTAVSSRTVNYRPFEIIGLPEWVITSNETYSTEYPLELIQVIGLKRWWNGSTLQLSFRIVHVECIIGAWRTACKFELGLSSSVCKQCDRSLLRKTVHIPNK